MNKSTARKSDGNGHPDFFVRGIGPINKRTGKLELRTGQYFELQIVNIPKDGQQGGKLKLVRLSNELLHQAFKIGLPIAGVANVLGSLIEKRGLYFDSVGEFFQLFGRFEQMLGLPDDYKQLEIECEMQARLGNEVVQYSREYVRAGIKSFKPLPLYVRNVLTHREPGKLSRRWGRGDCDTFVEGLVGSIIVGGRRRTHEEQHRENVTRSGTTLNCETAMLFVETYWLPLSAVRYAEPRWLRRVGLEFKAGMVISAHRGQPTMRRGTSRDSIHARRVRQGLEVRGRQGSRGCSAGRSACQPSSNPS